MFLELNFNYGINFLQTQAKVQKKKKSWEQTSLNFNNGTGRLMINRVVLIGDI